MDSVYKSEVIELGHTPAELNPEVKAQWRSALRSGEYSQGRDFLRFKEVYCCLGVLCEISPIAGSRYWDESHSYGGEYTLLPASVRNWAGFPETNANGNFLVTDSVRKRFPGSFTSGELGTYSSLAYLNDCAGWTFDQIADLIEYVF